jgi:hypothetical protein
MWREHLGMLLGDQHALRRMAGLTDGASLADYVHASWVARGRNGNRLGIGAFKSWSASSALRPIG